MKIWRQRIFVLASLFAFVGIISAALFAQDDGDAWAKKKSAWLLLTPAQHASGSGICRGLQRLSRCRQNRAALDARGNSPRARRGLH